MHIFIHVFIGRKAERQRMLRLALFQSIKLSCGSRSLQSPSVFQTHLLRKTDLLRLRAKIKKTLRCNCCIPDRLIPR